MMNFNKNNKKMIKINKKMIKKKKKMLLRNIKLKEDQINQIKNLSLCKRFMIS